MHPLTLASFDSTRMAADALARLRAMGVHDEQLTVLTCLAAEPRAHVAPRSPGDPCARLPMGLQVLLVPGAGPARFLSCRAGGFQLRFRAPAGTALKDALETTALAGLLAPEELRFAEEALMRHRAVVIVGDGERQQAILKVLRGTGGEPVEVAGGGASREPAPATAPRFHGGAWVFHNSALKEAQSS